MILNRQLPKVAILCSDLDRYNKNDLARSFYKHLKNVCCKDYNVIYHNFSYQSSNSQEGIVYESSYSMEDYFREYYAAIMLISVDFLLSHHVLNLELPNLLKKIQKERKEFKIFSLNHSVCSTENSFLNELELIKISIILEKIKKSDMNQILTNTTDEIFKSL